MAKRGMSWTLDVEVVDKGATKELAKLQQAQERAAREAVEAARKVEQAAASEAQAVRKAAGDKRAAAERSAAAARRAAEAEERAAREASRANSDAARKRLADAQQVTRAARQTAQAAEREANAAEKSARERERASDRATRAVKQAEREHRQSSQRVIRTEQQVAEQHTRSRTAARNAASSLKSYAKVAAGLAGSAGLGAVVRSAYRMDKSMREVRAVSGATGKELAALTETAKQLGLETGAGATAAAGALVELSKAGLTTKQLEPALKGVLQLSQAGGLSAAEAATAASDAMNAFSLSADKATDIADAFANAANLTTADVSDFAQAISQGGSAAKLAGVSFEDTVLTLTELAQIGVKGSDAGTSMKAAFLQLAKPTKQAQEAMSKFGLAFFDSEGRMKSVADIGDMLQKQLGGLSKQQQVATLQTVAGTDGFRTLAAMMGVSKEEAKQLQAQLVAAGSAGRMAADMQTPWERFRATMEHVAITVGEPLLDKLGEAADSIAKFAQSEEGQRTLKGVADALSDVAETTGKVVSAVAKFVGEHPKILKVAAGMAAVAAAVKTIKFAGAITGVNSLLRGLGRLLPVGRRAGAQLGTELGAELASSAGANARGGLRKPGALTGGLAGRMKSVGATLGGWLGLPMGKTAADKAADGIGASGAITGKAGGRMAPIGRGLGVLMGAALAAAAINELTRVFTGSSITERLRQGMGLDGAPGSSSFDDALKSGKPLRPTAKQRQEAEDFARLMRPNRRGGRITAFAAGGLASAALALGVPAFAAGGMVPAIVSPGELIEYQGAAGIVPGARVAADTVPMMLPIGARVYTDHGQALLAMGASPEQALAQQLPHFRTGGETDKKGKKSRPVRSARVGYTVFDDPPPGAFGSLTNGYAELGTARRTDGKGTGFGWLAKALGLKGELPANTPLTITINGKTHTLRKRDRGYGQGGDGRTSDPRYALDVWKDSWSKFGINANSKGMATVSLGTAAQAKAAGTTGRDYSYTVARRYGKSATRSGLLDDAYSLGYSGVETWGSRAAARRAGASLGVSAIREALDAQQDSYTRTVTVSAPTSRSGASSGPGALQKPGPVSGGWARPVTGPVTSRFGMRNGRMHKGIDFGVPIGTAVRAVRAGTVAAGIADPGGWGMNTRVEHGGGLSSLYAHLSGIALKPGSKVSAGQVIAKSGNTGRSTGPHLHLETWRNGSAFDPTSVIKLRRGGRIGRFATGGVAKALGAVRRSSSDGNLSAFGAALENAALARVQRLHDSLLKEIRAGGDRRTIDRIRAAVSQIEIDIAGRIQERLAGVAELGLDWESKLESSSHWMRRAGVDEGSSQGIAIQRINNETFLGSQSRSQLVDANAAIRQARAAVKRSPTEANQAKLTKAKDEKSAILKARTEARTVLEELKRALPQALAGERVGRLEWRDAMLGAWGQDPTRNAGVLAEWQGEWTAQLAEATRLGNMEWQTQAAGQLASINQSLRELPSQMAAREDATYDFRAALAALTESDADDRALLVEREQRVQQRLDQALVDLASSTTDADRETAERRATEQATLLKGIRDELKASNTAQQERDEREEDMRDLLRQIAESSARSARGAERQAGVTERWRTDVASGQIAANVVRRGATPGYAGGGVRG